MAIEARRADQTSQWEYEMWAEKEQMEGKEAILGEGEKLGWSRGRNLVSEDTWNWAVWNAKAKAAKSLWK